METYEGEYPVPDEWVEAHLDDEQVAFVYGVDLNTLIDLDGIEGMNNHLDDTLGMTGATLTDIRYFQHKANPQDDLGDLVLIRAEGVLEDYS
jgi:hypothetical protein